ncbi:MULTISPECIES: hypothetical protein [Gammaproteobacteria]|uniref:hypothetical protein n=1 Tax=Gammaproteobacteria TaxID=1236 RepID=UPI003A8D00D2
MAYLKAQYASVTTPIMGTNAWDDLWALPQSRDASSRPKPQSYRDIEVHGCSIGHMGYFRPACQWLWENMLRWLQSPITETQLRQSWALDKEKELFPQLPI